MNREDVLDAYRKGDDGRRLSLFLAYRDLRDQFADIEEEDLGDDLVVLRFPWNRKHWHKKHVAAHAA